MLTINFNLDAWCAFSPGGLAHSATELLDQETATDVKFLPPIKRRRLSALSRLSLRLAHTIAPEFQGFCVFGSQHGELVTTQGLLQSIVEQQVVSPAGFSVSVHNTAAGLHSINNQNTSACTSIAAGLDTLAMCFVEAYGLLESARQKQVLVVFADDGLPDELAEFAKLNQLHGMAAVISLNNGKQRAGLISVRLEQAKNNLEPANSDPVATVTGCLLERRSHCSTPGELNDWNWKFSVA